MALLDYSQYFRFTKQPLPDNRTGIFEWLASDRLIVQDVGGRWNITNLGAILFANKLGDFAASLARKAVRFVAYNGTNRAATFAEMTPEERVRACYFHAVLKFLSGDEMKNASLCVRLGIDPKNASQATGVINKTLAAGLIRAADLDHPREGYVPHWA